jgi:hypothetical protein
MGLESEMRIEERGHRHPATWTPLASVRPDSRDWHVAHVPVVELSDVHWDRPASAARRGDGPLLCAFTSCDAVVAGELPHGQGTGAHPHAVLVCILREDNDRVVFDRLMLEAGPRPRRFDAEGAAARP